MIKILDQEKLVRIFNVISWLDNKRWNPENLQNYVNFFRDDLTNCEKVLTHWICYITDRRTPFEQVWDKGGSVFSEMVYEYSRSQLSSQQILTKYYESYTTKDEVHYRFKSPTRKGITFASRYVTVDFEAIKQTLEILDNQTYKRNIVSFIVDALQKVGTEQDILLRVACALHLLSYQLNRNRADSANILQILKNQNKFNNKLDKFKRYSTDDKKRLWCCIRDYKKGLFYKIIINGIKEVCNNNDYLAVSNIWSQLPMHLIELPGDVWNNNPLTRNNLFENVIDLNSIPRSWEMPKIIRNLFDSYKDNKEIHNFYPEQFDITFDFVPRMCTKKLCNVCPLGPKGAELVCIPTEEKLCPVALISCGYITKCCGRENRCLIKENIGKGICKGAL